jgi:hypothetical protein
VFSLPSEDDGGQRLHHVDQPCKLGPASLNVVSFCRPGWGPVAPRKASSGSFRGHANGEHLRSRTPAHPIRTMFGGPPATARWKEGGRAAGCGLRAFLISDRYPPPFRRCRFVLFHRLNDACERPDSGADGARHRNGRSMKQSFRRDPRTSLVCYVELAHSGVPPRFFRVTIARNLTCWRRVGRTGAASAGPFLWRGRRRPPEVAAAIFQSARKPAGTLAALETGDKQRFLSYANLATRLNKQTSNRGLKCRCYAIYA